MSTDQAPVTVNDAAPHLLVVDDDTRIRTLLERYLRDHGYRVSTAANAAAARALLASVAFDLLVLDVMMPGEDGISLTAFLRTRSDVPILILTARGESDDRIKGLEAGADDYLAKPFEPRELLLRIATIIKRARPAIADGDEIVFGECRFDPKRGELTRDGNPVRLTTAEVGILRLLAANAGRAISRLELSDKTGAGLERSVDVQITRLRRKVEPDPKLPLYLQTVRGVGYMLMPD